MNSPKFQSLGCTIGYLRKTGEAWELHTLDGIAIAVKSLRSQISKKLEAFPELQSAPVLWRSHIRTDASGEYFLHVLGYSLKGEAGAIVSGKIVSLQSDSLVLKVYPNNPDLKSFTPFNVTIFGQIPGAKLCDIWRVHCDFEGNRLMVRSAELVELAPSKPKRKSKKRSSLIRKRDRAELSAIS